MGTRTRLLSVGLLACLALVTLSCGDDDGADSSSTTDAPAETTSTTDDDAGNTTTTEDDTTTTSTEAEDGAGADEPVDLLTVGAGTTVSSVTAGASISAGDAVRIIDGEPTKVTLAKDDSPPVEIVLALPAPTTFEEFVVPGIEEASGNATFFEEIEISGSAEGPTAGFETLVSAELPPPDDGEDAVFEVESSTPVRWLKVVLQGGQLIEDPPGSTNLEFTELVGHGTQEEVELSTGFTGMWDFRFLDAPDREGPVLELKQEGSIVSGCFETTTLTGNVTGSVARLQGFDSTTEQDSVYVFVVTGEGTLQGMESTNGGIFRARVAPVAGPDATSPCSDAPPPAPPTCDAILYINFDVNSATIRPDSTQVLDDLAAGIEGTEGPVTIEGHTSTEGTDEANLELSQGRAEAVVAALVERGIEDDRLEAVGKGESAPLVDEVDETTRSLNRRVVVGCG